MEDNGNKKTVVFLFFIMVGMFLFNYKGFIKNNDNYLVEYKNYIDSLSNNKSNLSWLKGTKIKNENSTHFNKSKIPPEIMTMDNTLLDMKSLLNVLRDKNQKLYDYTNQLYELLSLNSKNGSELNQTIDQIYQMIKGAKNEFDIEKSQIDKNIDELTTNLEQLRKYEVTPVKTK